MTLNYPVYDVRTGKRLYFGPPDGSYGNTYGSPIFTAAEFHHTLRWIKSKGFDVYANSHFGGINLTAHSPKSWHYVKDGYGRSLGADIGTYGNVNERARLINDLIPVLDRMGMAWHYARDGAVPGHYDHLHVDVSNWGRKGGPYPGYGYYNTYRKQNPLTYLTTTSGSISTGSIIKRKPKAIAVYQGATGNIVKVVQAIAGVKVDGTFGPATVTGVKALQRRLGISQDGSFGPGTARAYLASVGTRRKGATGHSVKIIQYIAGVTMDGTFGSGTETAVKQMQAYCGITTDGIFGEQSRRYIIR